MIFEKDGAKDIVIITGKDIKFGNTDFGAQVAGIEGLALSYQGVIKEFPDLKDDKDWKQKSIQKFKDKISSMNTEDEIAEFIKEDLKSGGFKPLLKQKGGFRIQPMK
jgi:hypothetical protein